jgi:2-polyprenyl-3-methyl-5-hydroxy-6-metoxy-1,4-benzoquinol methylase
MIRRAPTLTIEQHVEQVGLKDIERPLPCPLCHGRTIQPLMHPERPGRWVYHVVRCTGCGFLYRHPGIEPERLGELYSGNYGAFLTGRYAAKRRLRYEQALDRFSPLFDDGRGRRLLDFGCGAGLFLELAHHRGFEGYGVDLSPDAVRRARRKRSGKRAFVGRPEDVPEIAAGGFDVVTMWSVMAHLATPVEDLTTLRRLLRPDGMLVILTVNADSLILKHDLGSWGGFTPNHLMFYSPTTLRELLRQAGFGATVVRSLHGHAVEAGTVRMPGIVRRRLDAATGRGEQANMLDVVAFADPEGPARLGLDRPLRAGQAFAPRPRGATTVTVPTAPPSS